MIKIRTNTANVLNPLASAGPVIQVAMKSIWPVLQTDTQGFVTAVAPAVTGITTPLTTTTYVTLKYPSYSDFCVN